MKDVLAHVTSWERLCLKWIARGGRDEGPFTEESLDALNASMYSAHRDQTLDAIRSESRRSYETLVATIEALTSDLDASPPWGGDVLTDGRATPTLGETIRANSDEHYCDHIDQISAWLAGKR